MAINCLSKAKQTQSFYDHTSKFMKSAEWIVIINKLKVLLNIENEKKTTATEMVDILSPQEIGKTNNDDNDKEKQTTIYISDNDTTEEVKTERGHNIESITGFTHGKRHKDGVVRSKHAPIKGKNNEN